MAGPAGLVPECRRHACCSVLLMSSNSTSPMTHLVARLGVGVKALEVVHVALQRDLGVFPALALLVELALLLRNLEPGMNHEGVVT